MIFAQQNVQLYKQMRQKGYAEEDLTQAALAYEFASKMRAQYYRGCGKPFICHLVGVASILAELKQDISLVVAGLLHAAYHKNSDFGPDIELNDKRTIISDKFGPQVEGLIYGYKVFKWEYKSGQIDPKEVQSLKSTEKNVVLLRIANELEDFLDGSIVYCGKKKESPSARKGRSWRLDYLKSSSADLADASLALGFDDLATWINEHVEYTLVMDVNKNLVSGKNKSFKRYSPTVRKKLKAVK